MTKENIYETAPFFFIRTPIYPFELFHKISPSLKEDNSILDLYKKLPEAQNAIQLASPSLDYHLKIFASKNSNKKQKSLLESLYFYLSRSCTRSTPFGLFAAVSRGHWSEKTDLLLEENSFRSNFHPDAEWLWHLNQSIRKQPGVLEQLQVKKNSFIVENGVELFLSHKVQNHMNKCLRKTPLISRLFESCSNFTTVSAIYFDLTKHFPNLELSKFYTFLHQLLDQEFLVSNLPLSLYDETPLESTLNFLEENHITVEIVEFLKMIQHHILQLKKHPLNLPFSNNSLLFNSMKNIAEVPHYLYETLVNAHRNTLGKSIQKELTQSINLFWRIFEKLTPYPHLKKYHNSFVNKYGCGIKVPFLDLIDECIGLGLPEREAKDKNNKKDSKLQEWFRQKVLKAIINQEKNINLLSQELEKFAKEHDNFLAPSSLDVFCEIYPGSKGRFSDDNFLLHLYPISGNVSGCSSAGRFIKDLQMESEVEKLFLEEEKLLPNFRFVDLDFWPSKVRGANVCRKTFLRKTILNLNNIKKCTEETFLNEIFVFATSDSFYLCDEADNLLYFPNNLLLNPTLMPESIRLLIELSSHHIKTIDTHLWSLKQPLSYVPRITYKKTILSLSQWKLNLNSIGSMADNKETLIKNLKTWLTDFHCARWVKLTDGSDKKIVLDLKDQFSLEVILKQILKNPSLDVYLIEIPEGSSFFHSSKGEHFSEFIFPIIKKEQFAFECPSAPILKYRSYKELLEPSSSWYSYHIYLPEKNEIIFLIEYLLPFSKWLNEHNIKWFFIRYNDELGNHIRLRFQPRTGDGEFFSTFQKWLLNLRKDKVLSKYIFHDYLPEIERYGGTILMPLAEDIFHYDSRLDLEILKHTSHNQDDLFLNFIESISHYFNSFDFSIEDQMNFFSKIGLSPKALEGYRESKKQIINVLSKTSESLKNSAFKKHYYKRNEKCTEYKEASANSSRLKIGLASFLHMSCNRVLGKNRDLEEKAYAFFAAGIKNLFLNNDCAKIK